MKKSELRQLIREEISSSNSIVYAVSTSTGQFEELVQIYKKDIISDSEENEDGVGICNTNHEEFFFIDKLEI